MRTWVLLSKKQKKESSTDVDNDREIMLRVFKAFEDYLKDEISENMTTDAMKIAMTDFSFSPEELAPLLGPDYATIWEKALTV